MNLPAHGTASPDPSKASVSVKSNTHKSYLQRNRLAQHPALLGYTGPDRLAVPTRRQAPAPLQRHCFIVTAWRSTPCRQAPAQCRPSHAKIIAWRLSVARQAPHQKSSTADFWHPHWFGSTRILPQVFTLLFHHYIRQSYPTIQQ